jgi:ribA/ribD-fused uncharacterized protein
MGVSKMFSGVINSFRDEYRFLSNFYESIIIINNKVYKSVEHWYQASKADNETLHEYIRNLPTPGNTKGVWKKKFVMIPIEGIKEQKPIQVRKRKDFNNINIDIMRQGINLKFEILSLRKLLNQTKGKMLIEGNTWHDNFWGNCSCEVCKNIEGENWLGKLLMEERDD